MANKCRCMVLAEKVVKDMLHLPQRQKELSPLFGANLQAQAIQIFRSGIRMCYGCSSSQRMLTVSDTMPATVQGPILKLLFLKDVVTPRASSGTFGPLIEDGMSSQQDTSLLDDSATSTGEASTRQSTSPTALPAESTPHDVYESASTRADQRAGPSKREQPRQAKRQKITDHQYKEILEMEKRKLEYFENKIKKKDPEDDDLLFLKSLLPYIKMIPTELKLHFRTQVQNVVTEFAFATTATNMQPSQSNVSCYDTTSTMRYPSQHTSNASTPSYYTSTRPPSASPHSYQSYDNSESSYNY
ncbi:transcription factor adf-1 [Plakobranchus ocellatus]|uniref:Transcription factor adf-1 n=1 Tax=Plakobranchus ocellatus TaxID=259542 RepID=A0AAV4C161_9GAST|nr:transcription factor adf-1 [Plakobranchus ocellatus]